MARRLHPFTLAALFTLIVAGSSSAGAGDTRIADAAARGDVAAVKSLMQQRADVNGAQGDGMTALHWAADRGDEELATLVIAAGADVAARTRLGGYTPLHIAAGGGRTAIVRRLLEAKASPAEKTTTGATPLHLAAAAGSLDLVSALLDRGAEVNAREPQWGQTPLMFAAAAGRHDIVQALARRGADLAVTARVVDLRERNQRDAADSRARNARIAAIQKERAAKLAAAAVPSAPPRPGGGAASRNVDNGNEPEPLGYAELVGAHGGLTALLLAARDGHHDTVMALLDAGADINQPGAGDRTTPLLIATINGHFALAKRLLERGADPALASDGGATPLYGVLNMQWAPKARHPQ
ncbi:MAG: ankyrin repeat domain-containing protein, partial [Alphaproteobacteria bacterium]|nr:ankyrin repeat domain-containing protein [Alphaproteobacteria bacterium]